MFPNAASEVRKVDPDYVKGQHDTLFTDGYPFLLASQVILAGNEVYILLICWIFYSVFVIYHFQESLNALNEHLKELISINRFRPKYWFFNVFLFTPEIVLFPNVCYLHTPRRCWTDLSRLLTHTIEFLGVSLCSILVEGCEPFSEDIWTEIKISKFSFYGVKLCYRCKVLYNVPPIIMRLKNWSTWLTLTLSIYDSSTRYSVMLF